MANKYYCNVVIKEGYNKQNVMSEFTNVVNSMDTSSRVFQVLLTKAEIDTQYDSIQDIELINNNVTDD